MSTTTTYLLCFPPVFWNVNMNFISGEPARDGTANSLFNSKLYKKCELATISDAAPDYIIITCKNT